MRQAGELAGLEGLVIPGGESTTMSKLMVAYGLEAPIRELHGGGCARVRHLRRHDPGRPGTPSTACPTSATWA